jgi:transglutaminase-like putative cysteine protease
MQITFNLPHVFFPGSPRDEDADALKALLDCLVQLNLDFLRKHRAVALYDSPVYYARTEIWDTIPALLQRGYGDCKSLTAALVAEYRIKGKDARPVFRWYDGPGGSKNYHILVQTRDGFEDPSKVKGMGSTALW